MTKPAPSPAALAATDQQFCEFRAQWRRVVRNAEVLLQATAGDATRAWAALACDLLDEFFGSVDNADDPNSVELAAVLAAGAMDRVVRMRRGHSR